MLLNTLKCADDLVAKNYGVLQRRRRDFHGEPAPRTIPTVPGAGVGDVPEVETIGLSGGGSKGSEFSWVDLLHICPTIGSPCPMSPAFSSEQNPAGPWGRPARWPQFISSRFAGLFSPGRPTSLPDCIASHRFLASPLTAGLLEETAPQGPHHAPWLHLDAEQDRQTFLLCRASAFLPPQPRPWLSVFTLQIISSASLSFPLSPIACSVLRPFCLFLLLIFPIDQMPWK